MSKEITVQSLGDAVRDKVRSVIFQSIPDEAIQTIMEKEFTSLKEKKHYNDRSEIQTIINDEIKRQIKERAVESVKKYLDDNFVAAPKETVNILVQEMAPLVMASFAQSFAVDCVNVLRSQIQNNRGF